MATLSGTGGLFDFSSLFQNLNLGGTFGTTGFGLDLTGGSGFSLGSNLFGGTGTTFGGSLFGGTGTGGFSLDFSNLFGGTSGNLFGSFGTGTGIDFSSLFGSGGTTFNFFS